MPASSGNTLQDIPRNNVDPLSGHLLAQPSWHIESWASLVGSDGKEPVCQCNSPEFNPHVDPWVRKNLHEINHHKKSPLLSFYRTLWSLFVTNVFPRRALETTFEFCAQQLLFQSLRKSLCIFLLRLNGCQMAPDSKFLESLPSYQIACLVWVTFCRCYVKSF